MKAFIDTSSLCKRYVQEEGSLVFEKFLDQVSQIFVSPVTWVELNSAISKRLRNHSMTSQQFSFAILEAKKDFESCHRIIWTQDLEVKAAHLVNEHPLSAMDAIQLASGVLSKADIFVTSDQKLFKEASKLMRKVQLI